MRLSHVQGWSDSGRAIPGGRGLGNFERTRAGKRLIFKPMRSNYFLTLALIVPSINLCQAQNSPIPTSPPTTGVEGIIRVGPIRGGPVRPGISSTKPLANKEFNVVSDKVTGTTFKTDEQGRFRVEMPPGHYLVSVKEEKKGVGGCGPFEIDVVAGQMKKVEWQCDTGIR